MDIKYLGWDGYNNYGDDSTKQIIGSLGFNFDNNSDILMFGAGTMLPVSDLLKNQIENQNFSKVVSLCSGVENPEFPTKDFEQKLQWLKEFIPNKDLISVRCEKDKEVLGFGTVVGDPFYMIDIKEPDNPPEKKNVIVNIGQSRSKVWGGLDGELDCFRNLCRFIKHELIENRNEKVYLFSVWDEDVPFLKMASTYTGAPFLTLTPTVKNMFSLIASAKYLISYKLHAMITALSTNTPVVPIEYRPKIRDVATGFNVDKFCLKTNEVTEQNLKNKIDMLSSWDYDFVNNKKQEYKQKIKDFVNKIKLECEL